MCFSSQNFSFIEIWIRIGLKHITGECSFSQHKKKWLKCKIDKRCFLCESVLKWFSLVQGLSIIPLHFQNYQLLSKVIYLFIQIIRDNQEIRLNFGSYQTICLTRVYNIINSLGSFISTYLSYIQKYLLSTWHFFLVFTRTNWFGVSYQSSFVKHVSL